MERSTQESAARQHVQQVERRIEEIRKQIQEHRRENVGGHPLYAVLGAYQALLELSRRNLTHEEAMERIRRPLMRRPGRVA